MKTTKFNKKASLGRFNQIPVGPQWITVRRAAEVLGVSSSTLRRWINKREIPAQLRDREGLTVQTRAALQQFVGDPYKTKRLYTVISKFDLEMIVNGETINAFISDFGKAA
jgi:predicted DNA-binding transcriptional regulator AlpA